MTVDGSHIKRWMNEEDEHARRVAIQASVSRRVDEKVRMLDPAIHGWTHAERVRRLVVQLGEIGALDPGEGWDYRIALEQTQDALVDFAAEVQAWAEQNLRDASR